MSSDAHMASCILIGQTGASSPAHSTDSHSIGVKNRVGICQNGKHFGPLPLSCVCVCVCVGGCWVVWVVVWVLRVCVSLCVCVCVCPSAAPGLCEFFSGMK